MPENKRKRTLKEDLRIMKRAIKLIEKHTPRFFLHTILYGLFGALIQVSSNYITASLIDELTGNKNVKMLVFLISMYATEILFNIFRDYSWRKIRVFHILSTQWEEIILNNKSFSMDYKNMENPEIRGKRQMIVDSRGVGGLNNLFFDLIAFWRGSIRTVLCIAVSMEMFFKHTEKPLTGFEAMIDSNFTTVIFFLFVAIFSYIEYKKMGIYAKQGVEINKKMSFAQRVLHYFLDDYLDNSKASKDVRIFNQQKLINHKSEEIFEKWKVHTKKYNVLDRKQQDLYNLITVLNTGATYLYVALKTYIGSFGLGGFFKYQFCIFRITESASAIAHVIADLRANNEYILLLFEYLDMPNEMQQGTMPVEKGTHNNYEIEFHNVSFKYPGTENYAIKNFSFKFRFGERIAVVGMNGSGKTTMIKLLCRLYDPTEGHITLNGVDKREYDYEDYLSLFSVVFQDFRLFSFSIGENISAGVDYDENRVWDALSIAGMRERVEEMPRKLKTSIYKDFDEQGVEISGGEAQKLAIARAFYKNAPFVILDEPTASLDPVAEYEIYSHFDNMVKDKTAVYISHRLSSCRFCDKIAVFHEGELIQFGSHKELLENREGKYSELWNAQAQYYQTASTQ